jgi:exosortase E/protease (VPEID-CTERM system)
MRFSPPLRTSPRGIEARPPRQAALSCCLAVAEVFLASFLFGFPAAGPDWANPVVYANLAAKLAIVAFLLFCMVAWPRRELVRQLYGATVGDQRRRHALYANAGLFLLLMLTRLTLASVSEVKSYQLAAYAVLLLATGGSLALVAAPFRFWRALAKSLPAEIAISGAGAVMVLGAARLTQDSWDALSNATLALSHWLLSLYERDVVLDQAQRILGVGDFTVRVFAECSGYEGIGLVCVFLAIYMWAFRASLRFPHALLLFPFGIAAIWLLNGVRIAVLISIGAHVSPAVAVEGFHSQGGWIAFLIIACSVIAVSQKVPFFMAVSAAGSRIGKPASGGAHVTLIYLAPFMALMAASVVASAAEPYDHWLYALKVAMIGGALWWFRDAYLPLLSGASAGSLMVGGLVGAIWIMTDPAPSADTPLGIWIASLPIWIAALWLALRAIGAIILIPVAEELAFRGYLHRALISSRFETVRQGEFRLLALAGSSLAFGLLHQRWAAAALAGAVYALLMYRTNRLSDAIAAHAASNALIVLWAVAARQWSLL